jgi:hypothetical protein
MIMNQALEHTILRKLISSSRLIKALSIIASVCIFFLPTFTPAIAGFLIDADFETGETLSYGMGPSGNTPEVVDASKHPVCRGNKSVMFPLDFYNSPSHYRTELSAGKHELTIGQEYWLGYAFFVPAGTGEPRGGMQLHGKKDEDLGEGNRNPIMSFWLRDGEWRFHTSWAADPVNATPGTKTTSDGAYSTILGPPTLGEWTEFVVHFKITYKPDGFVQIWQNGVKVLDKTGIGMGFNDARGPFFKFGIYAFEWNNPNNPKTPPSLEESVKLIYLDEVHLGDVQTSYADVAPRCGIDNGPPIPSPPINVNVR